MKGLIIVALVSLAQTGDLPPCHDCIPARDCQECGQACDAYYAPKSCQDPKGCWTAKMRNQTRMCFYDRCRLGRGLPPWHEPEN